MGKKTKGSAVDVPGIDRSGDLHDIKQVTEMLDGSRVPKKPANVPAADVPGIDRSGDSRAYKQVLEILKAAELRAFGGAGAGLPATQLPLAGQGVEKPALKTR